jgi:hypothetical protein
MGRHGVDEIKSHPFFDGVDWDSLRTRPAPWEPPSGRCVRACVLACVHVGAACACQLGHAGCAPRRRAHELMAELGALPTGDPRLAEIVKELTKASGGGRGGARARSVVA